MAKKTASKKTGKSTGKKKPSPVRSRAKASGSVKKGTSAAKPSGRKSTASAAGKPTTKKTAKKTTKTTKKAAKKVSKKAGSTPTAAKSSAKKISGTPKPTAAGSKTKQPAKKDAGATPATTKPKKHAQKSPGAKPEPKQAAASAPEPGNAAGSDKKKTGRKGITIVEPAKKPASRPKASSKFQMPQRPMLLGPGSKFTKPLIPSGPKAPKVTSVFDAPKSKRKKSPLTKSKLDHYRSLLIAKRALLLGDVESMEHEALRAGGGGLSNTPQHIAEQGSESYDQTLSLNLAAKDRRLIKEIDDALKRIDEGTYGLCELTMQPIPEARLDELPWARYSIEAAREIELRGYPQ